MEEVRSLFPPVAECRLDTFCTSGIFHRPEETQAREASVCVCGTWGGQVEKLKDARVGMWRSCVFSFFFSLPPPPCSSLCTKSTTLAKAENEGLEREVATPWAWKFLITARKIAFPKLYPASVTQQKKEPENVLAHTKIFEQVFTKDDLIRVPD
ncbi:hypothetical protein AVEN_265896-1 [Araneus ventricosus]|uniref:Uncharacterized protein n=1 Tax=Araneus ventricosus TaxID=182803 RepID=A0A4Y2JDI7_ARAVE|nr:hypothetical protein AVEN_265896-1 [Araneus ventricosus]